MSLPELDRVLEGYQRRETAAQTFRVSIRLVDQRCCDTRSACLSGHGQIMQIQAVRVIGECETATQGGQHALVLRIGKKVLKNVSLALIAAEEPFTRCSAVLVFRRAGLCHPCCIRRRCETFRSHGKNLDHVFNVGLGLDGGDRLQILDDPASDSSTVPVFVWRCSCILRNQVWLPGAWLLSWPRPFRPFCGST